MIVPLAGDLPRPSAALDFPAPMTSPSPTVVWILS
jgi:hypothetical protein